MITGSNDNNLSEEAATPPAAERRPKIIKRYSNRKLYDTERSKYVTLDEISQMIQAGEEVQIIDNKSNRDLTAVTLTQIIYEEEKRKSRMPLGMLRKLIQTGGDALEDFFDRSVKTPVTEIRHTAEKGIEEIKQSAQNLREVATQSFTEWSENARRVFMRSQSERLAKKVDDAVKRADAHFDELQKRLQGLLSEALNEEARIIQPVIDHVKKRVNDVEELLKKTHESAQTALENLEQRASEPPAPAEAMGETPAVPEVAPENPSER